MPYRRILLHIMLWSLGTGAVLGAAAVLTSGSQAFARISGTTLTTAVAAGLLIPISRLIDRPASRPAGMLGMWLVIGEFLLVLALIWDMGARLPWTNDGLWMTAVALPICGTVAAIMLRIALGDSRGRIAGMAGIGVAVVCFAVLMYAGWVTASWRERDRFMSIAGVTGLYGLLLFACLVGGQPWPRLRSMFLAGRATGVLAAIAGGAIADYAIWYDIDSDSVMFKIITSAACVIAHANLCLLVPLAGAQVWIRRVTVLAALGTAVSLNIAMASGLNSVDQDLASRVASAGGIITSCGSLALLVIARINRRVPSESRELPTIAEVTVVCPGCGRKQALPVGGSTCPACRLRFEIRVIEPHCPKCDYLLFMLKSDHCPECGEDLRGLPVTVGAAPEAG